MYVDYIKSYIEKNMGARVDNILFADGKAEITATGPGGERIVVKYIGTKIPLSAVDAEVTHEVHESESIDASYVYIALPGKRLVHVNRRTMQIVSEMNVGVLGVRDQGEVIEVRTPKLRKPVRPQGSDSLPVLSARRAAQEARRPLETSLGSMGEVSVSRAGTPGPAGAEPLPGVDQQPTVKSEDLPDFVKNNPWLSVLGMRGSRAKQE